MGDNSSRNNVPDPFLSGKELPTFKFELEKSKGKVLGDSFGKEVTVEQLPISKGIAGVSMQLEPGVMRELHWHATAAEWAFVLEGRVRTTVIDPQGASETNDFDSGDVWYFPRGHGHMLQCLGDKPCHFILIFDNGPHRLDQTFPFSRVIEIDPKANRIVWSYQEAIPSNFFSPRISNAQRLPNGNTLIDEGFFGRFFEVTPGGETVWEYINPYFGPAGAPANTQSNNVFRVYRYTDEEIADADEALRDEGLVCPTPVERAEAVRLARSYMDGHRGWREAMRLAAISTMGKFFAIPRYALLIAPHPITPTRTLSAMVNDSRL